MNAPTVACDDCCKPLDVPPEEAAAMDPPGPWLCGPCSGLVDPLEGTEFEIRHRLDRGWEIRDFAGAWWWEHPDRLELPPPMALTPAETEAWEQLKERT